MHREAPLKEPKAALFFRAILKASFLLGAPSWDLLSDPMRGWGRPCLALAPTLTKTGLFANLPSGWLVIYPTLANLTSPEQSVLHCHQIGVVHRDLKVGCSMIVSSACADFYRGKVAIARLLNAPAPFAFRAPLSMLQPENFLLTSEGALKVRCVKLLISRRRLFEGEGGGGRRGWDSPP